MLLRDREVWEILKRIETLLAAGSNP